MMGMRQTRVAARWASDDAELRLVVVSDGQTKPIGIIERLERDTAGGERWTTVGYQGYGGRPTLVEQILLDGILKLAGERDAVAATMDHSQKRFG